MCLSFVPNGERLPAVSSSDASGGDVATVDEDDAKVFVIDDV